jgi:hypothetical protein
MKKFVTLLACILTFMLLPLGSQAQLLSPMFHVQGGIQQDTMLISLGKTGIVSTIYGQPVESFTDMASLESYITSPLVQDAVGESYDLNLLEDLHAVPLFGNASISNVESITIINIEELQQINLDNVSMENLTQLLQSVDIFTNVDVQIKKGMSLLGIGGKGIHLDTELPYAISTIIDDELIEGVSYPLLVLMTNDVFSFTYNGGTSLLYVSSDATEITIKNTSGTVLWSEPASGKIFLLKEPSLSVFQQSTFYAYPLPTDNQTTLLSISPADAPSSELPFLIKQLSELAEYQDSLSIPDISSFAENIEPFLGLSAQVLNGAMILVGSEDTLIIDHTRQPVKNIGLGRADTFDIHIQAENSSLMTVEGDYKLVFLGDHLYTLQAPESDQGVALPLFIIALWALSLGVFLFLRMYPFKKKEGGKKWNTQILKKYGLLIHVAALLIVFILMDREISFQFGVSALDVLFGQGASVILAGILLVELIMWVVGFIVVALPLRMIINSIIKYIGIDKEGKVIGKSLGALGIWIFSALYVKLMINLLFLFLQSNMLFPMG